MDELLQGGNEAVGGVVGEERMLDADDSAGSIGGDFSGEDPSFRAKDDGGDCFRRGEALCGGEGFQS